MKKLLKLHEIYKIKKYSIVIYICEFIYKNDVQWKYEDQIRSNLVRKYVKDQFKMVYDGKKVILGKFKIEKMCKNGYNMRKTWYCNVKMAYDMRKRDIGKVKIAKCVKNGK